MNKMFKAGDVALINWGARGEIPAYWMEFGDIQILKKDGVKSVIIDEVIDGDWHIHVNGTYRVRSTNNIHRMSDEMFFPPSKAIQLFVKE